MLSQEAIKKIAGIIKADPKVLEEAIKSEKETPVDIPELSVFTADELKTRDGNIEKTHYDNGRTAGVEMLIKDLKAKYGVELEGKDPEKFMNAFKSKIENDAKIQPDEKVKELSGTVTKLQDNIKTLQSEKEDLSKQLKNIGLTSKVLSSVEKEYLIGKSDMLSIMKSNGYSFEEEENKIVAKLNGNIIRDNMTQSPLSVDKVFDSYATEKKWIKEPVRSGRGDGSSGGGKEIPSSLSEFEKQWKEDGKSTNSAEFLAKAQEYAKDNKDFFDK